MAGIVHGMMMLVARGMSAEHVARIGRRGHFLVEQAERVLAGRATGSGHVHQMNLEKMLETYFRSGAAAEQESAFPGFHVPSVALNTALALGAPPIRVVARVHAQCELHLWIEEGEAPAIAKVIAEALKTGIFRIGVGWRKVHDLLRTPGIGEVVLSYSTTGSFPNSAVAVSDRLPGVAPLRGKVEPTGQELARAEAEWSAREAAWDLLDRDEQWAAGIAGLREQDPGLRLTGASIASRDFRFGDGKTAADLIKPAT